MRFALFSKELFGGKKKLIMFCVFSVMIYLLVGIQIVMLVKTSNSAIMPDLIFTGSGFIDSMPFTKYQNINDGYSDAVDQALEHQSQSYNLIERNLITVTKLNSLENVNYSIFACDNNFLKDKLESEIIEGSIPEEGKMQAIVGGYFAKAFDIKVGDVVSKKFGLGNLSDVSIVSDINGIFEDKYEYEIVGILDNTDGYFDYSFIIPSATQPGNQANTVWTYFDNTSVSDLYVEKFVNNGTIDFTEYGVHGISEKYQSKASGPFDLILNNAYIFLLVIVFSYILIAYVMKGVTYKLGVMKAIGVSNKYIYSCYFGGVFLIQIVSFIFGIGFMKVLCNGLNSMISESYGFTVNIYRITGNMVMIIILMLVVTLATFLLSLQNKINHIKPKIAMNMKG